MLMLMFETFDAKASFGWTAIWNSALKSAVSISLLCNIFKKKSLFDCSSYCFWCSIEFFLIYALYHAGIGYSKQLNLNLERECAPI